MPTSSRSLCLPPARMHFCEFTARVSLARSDFGSALPRKIGLYWFIPALVNSSVGSLCGTTEDDRQNVCAAFSVKKSMYCCRTAAPSVGSAAPQWDSFGSGEDIF